MKAEYYIIKAEPFVKRMLAYRRKIVSEAFFINKENEVNSLFERSILYWEIELYILSSTEQDEKK